ncbi:hypothetical protein I3760_07G026900 [Carya illinoinensis]|uniref:Uncharacterized protein n=1 Tax=Carya illinoinensis TaxID=32201 RepID=A0A922EHZ8_CARIL|nr:hypothetical protein I3760_07G026900 [Carya illinoinensis]KAG6702315.1 hypothetical protein I3842_07G028400 [Carya illinoinensis]
MEELGYRSYGVERNLEIVSVKASAENRIFVGGRSRPYSFEHPFSPRKHKVIKATKTSKKWWNDPEMKRRRRVAKYKLYSAEGKMKISLKKGMHWLKKKCIMMVRRL